MFNAILFCSIFSMKKTYRDSLFIANFTIFKRLKQWFLTCVARNIVVAAKSFKKYLKLLVLFEKLPYEQSREGFVGFLCRGAMLEKPWMEKEFRRIFNLFVF
jgi:hypothetical protein